MDYVTKARRFYRDVGQGTMHCRHKTPLPLCRSMITLPAPCSTCLPPPTCRPRAAHACVMVSVAVSVLHHARAGALEALGQVDLVGVLKLPGACHAYVEGGSAGAAQAAACARKEDV